MDTYALILIQTMDWSTSTGNNFYKKGRGVFDLAVLEPKKLASEIRQGNLDKLYYIYGADLVQVRQLTTSIIKKATDGNPEMALTKLDGQKLDLDVLTDAARQFSMFAPRNCIQVHDLNAESLQENSLKRLLELLSQLGEATVLIFDVTGFDPKNGRKTPQGKNKKLIDAVAKYGTVCEAKQRSFPTLARELAAIAQKNSAVLPIECAEELVRLCMGNTLILRSELEKLCAYADGKKITMAMVRETVSPQLETTTFNLAKAVVSQRPRSAMEELNKLYAMRTDRTAIVAAIASSFLDLYRASAAMRAGKSEADMKRDFGYIYDFMIQNAFRDCNRIPPERLRACILVLRDLEQTLNSTQADERILLESAIVKMLKIAGG